MAERVSSLDRTYSVGSLSSFPNFIDDKYSLYEVANNAETKLKVGLPYNGKKIIVNDTSLFPEKGIVRVGPPAGVAGDAELVYYNSKTNNTFNDLTRGFAGSRQNQWPVGSFVTNTVTAEPHNAVKDAIINVQRFLGLKDNPDQETLNRRLKDLELKFLSPKATFRSFPRKTRPGVVVKFQNFCEGDIVRYVWDFGDGTSSVSPSPEHVYANEGTYTVKLHIITGTGAQGISTKENYITVSLDEKLAFFYVKKIGAKKYRFIDQTDGEIKQRFWVFGGEGKVGNNTNIVQNYVEIDPDKHEVIFEYLEKGNYEPSLLINFASDKIKRIFLSGKSLEVV